MAPHRLRPAVGGGLLGALLLVLPQMYGGRLPVLQNGVAGRQAAAFLLVLLAGKMLATSLAIGIGGSGGVFAPSLFMGAMLGTAFGDLLHLVVPQLAGPAGAYGLVGMGAVSAGAARAPITAVLIIFELTGDYAIVLPLMTAVVLATAVSRTMSGDTIYTSSCAAAASTSCAASQPAPWNSSPSPTRCGPSRPAWLRRPRRTK